MQKSIYGNIELVYDQSTLTVQSNTRHRLKTMALFGFWLYSSVMMLIGGIVVAHELLWIVIGAVLTLFNGMMLAFQFMPVNSPCIFDIAESVVRRGKTAIPFDDIVSIDAQKQSTLYTLWVKVKGRDKQALNGLAPIRLAEARRLAAEITQFTGIAVGGLEAAPVGQQSSI